MKKSSKPIIEYITPFIEYCEIEKGLSDKTQENYQLFLKKFTEWLRANKNTSLRPHELTNEYIWNYRVYLARQKSSRTSRLLSKASQTHYLVALRNLLIYFTNKDILSLPADKIKLPKEKDKSVKFLKLKHIERLLLTPNINTRTGLRDRAILETLFSTGLRVSELITLNKDQIVDHSQEEYLEIPIVGKGGSTRAVYFSPRSINWLKKYLNTRKDMDRALFINYRGPKDSSRRLTVRSVEILVKKHSAVAGLSQITTPHTLRHSYATDLLAQGVDLRLIQEFLGHKNIATTQIYTHVVNKQLKDVHRKHHSGSKIKN